MKRTDRFAFQIDLFAGPVRVNLASGITRKCWRGVRRV